MRRCSLPVSSFQRMSNCGQTPMTLRILSMPPGLLSASPAPRKEHLTESKPLALSPKAHAADSHTARQCT